jgi:hypothetical protein
VNLSTGRVLVIVALIVVGLAVLANGFADEGTAAASTTLSPSAGGGGGASPTDSVSPTETEPPTSTPPPNTKGVLFMALNGTTVTGAGAAAQDLLTNGGYTKVADAVDAPTQDIKKTTIYYRPDQNGQNQADATYVQQKYFKGAAVKKLNPDVQNAGVPDSAAIVVVVGADWATKITS